MNIVKIMRRALTFLPARVFTTPSPSPCYLPSLAVFFVSLYKLHPDSWLLSTSFWLSCLCGCAREADRDRMLHFMRRCSAGDEELDESRFTVVVADAVDVSRVCKFICALRLQLLVGPFLVCLSWPLFCLFIC
ncbi:hypothetical protein D8674_031099 [Pyrus ussuriensis x Pyrus communis]|uniref:Uncharacterized protein n=1 Tax=Pyrus ussuriensis x Pyrus communis TaxID=2448454 RepID=A0A5N5EXJ2_9ROSA|nr:hypothetical protein D8674_031099 [Pyrus ussuriensis x Pyrus communis]